MKNEIYISVDIETAGPIPNEYSMLSLGACVVGSPENKFYVELSPINRNMISEAMAISKLSFDELTEKGLKPAKAMQQFADWLLERTSTHIPIFVGFNVAFDWAFVNWYFHKYLNHNPFGFSAIDIKAYYMGLSGCSWSETTSRQLPEQFQPNHPQTHNALDDAIAQAEIFQKLLAADRPIR